MPTPSPDGRSVAFTTDNYGGQLTILDLASRTTRTVGTLPETIAPRWSPDGNWIAYTRYFSSALTLIRPDGTGLRRITGPFIGGAGISWSPDSRWVIGTVGSVGTAGSAVLFDINDGSSVTLPWSGIYPAWRR
jgi:Tol biopolymer transport system component